MNLTGVRPVSYVTGGGGFLGGHLVRSLLDEGCRVVLIEKPGFNSSNINQSIELRLADIRDSGAVEAAWLVVGGAASQRGLRAAGIAVSAVEDRHVGSG